MAFAQSMGTFAAAVTLCLFIVNLNIETCNSQQLNNINDYSGAQAYRPDTGLLDFVYHSHDDMTRFLRFGISECSFVHFFFKFRNVFE